MTVDPSPAASVRLQPGPAVQPAPFEESWVPRGYRGPVMLPGTGRLVWWTGRIAIGLRYSPHRPH